MYCETSITGEGRNRASNYSADLHDDYYDYTTAYMYIYYKLSSVCVCVCVYPNTHAHICGYYIL